MTVKSPKDLFFPQSEDLMAFRVSGKSIEIENPVLPTEPFVLFGVRACDARKLRRARPRLPLRARGQLL